MTPVASMVGRSVMDWDQEITFPRPSFDETLPLVFASGDGKYLQSSQHVDAVNATNAIVGATSSTAGGGCRYGAAYGVGAADSSPVYQLFGNAPGDSMRICLDGLAAVLPVTTLGAATASGASYPSASRVWWLKMLVRFYMDGGANPANGTGVLVVPSNAMVPNWPTQLVGANNRGGFGLVQDGANNWTYRSFDRTGVGLARETIALPVHDVDDYNLAEWVIVAKRPGFQAYTEFWFNNTLICTRNWTGALLEPIGGIPAADSHEWKWVPSAQVLNQNGLFLSGVMRAGRFLRDGTEIQG